MKQNDMKASKDNTDWRAGAVDESDFNLLLFRHHVPKYKRHYLCKPASRFAKNRRRRAWRARARARVQNFGGRWSAWSSPHYFSCSAALSRQTVRAAVIKLKWERSRHATHLRDLIFPLGDREKGTPRSTYNRRLLTCLLRYLGYRYLGSSSAATPTVKRTLSTY